MIDRWHTVPFAPQVSLLKDRPTPSTTPLPPQVFNIPSSLRIQNVIKLGFIRQYLRNIWNDGDYMHLPTLYAIQVRLVKVNNLYNKI